MFLDPYGTQVSWTTIKAIADTRAIDLWILFPIGTVNRLLNRDGQIIEGRKKRCGETRSLERIYTWSGNNSLFPEVSITTFSKTSDLVKQIASYLLER